MSNGITRIAWPVALQFSCQTDLDAKLLPSDKDQALGGIAVAQIESLME
jgi:hypothetical protein